MQPFGIPPPMENLEDIAKEITDGLRSIPAVIDGLVNATEEKKNEVLKMLNSTVEAGLADALNFQLSAEYFLQGVIAELGHKLGVNVSAARPKEGGEQPQIYDTLGALMEASAKLAESLKSALDNMFDAPYEATKAAVEESGAAGFPGQTGLLLALACAAVSWF
mmetsp:Transcript_461/g.1518  ORF Transcript_461/g.1518 Transcript_461/m.1518 type:complete len:164 (-) Transcript_461:11-502(-)